ncbi:hypothetical protein NUW54_g12907 [Trametes sanguinea]|uniref:Uncharacterized protein n=1 Tax=Trametes sanguinea TaxID=158606 RepID=A0ACC1MSU1_9APHY|nr:hypothetical protein NUW54_g12907 [Trametes sanguinea]
MQCLLPPPADTPYDIASLASTASAKSRSRSSSLTDYLTSPHSHPRIPHPSPPYQPPLSSLVNRHTPPTRIASQPCPLKRQRKAAERDNAHSSPRRQSMHRPLTYSVSPARRAARQRTGLAVRPHHTHTNVSLSPQCQPPPQPPTTTQRKRLTSHPARPHQRPHTPYPSFPPPAPAARALEGQTRARARARRGARTARRRRAGRARRSTGARRRSSRGRAPRSRSRVRRTWARGGGGGGGGDGKDCRREEEEEEQRERAHSEVRSGVCSCGEFHGDSVPPSRPF